MTDKSQAIRILFAEDLPEDVELAQREIKKRDIKFTFKSVDTEPEFVKELNDFSPDIVISDYSMPTFDGMQALEITRKFHTHIPFIILTGSMNEETAVECMKSGADDYVIKEQIARLPFAIKEVLSKVRAEKEKEWLQHLLLKISRLSVKEIGLKDFLKAIHREIKKIMKADNFTIVLYDNPSGKYTIPYISDEYDDLTTDEPISLKNTLTDYIRKTAKSRLVTEADESKLRKEEKIHVVGTPSPVWLGVPVKDMTSGKVSGVIILQDYKDKDAYDESDLKLLEVIASEIGVFIDRKRDQEKLKHSEEKFRTLFRDHSAVKLIIDPNNGNIIEANKAAADFYGWPVEELEQKSIFQINTLPPDKINAEMDRALENRKTIFEFKHRKADGSICDVEVFGSRVQIEDKVFIHSIVHDISEKKKTEEKLKLISRSVDQSPVSIVITDANGVIEYTNPAFTQISGYSFEEVKGENPRILQSGDHTKEFYKNLWDTILAGKDWQGEFHDQKKNGDFYWEQAVISPIRNHKGEITHFVAVKEDITEKKKVFEDLKAAKEKVEISEERIRKAQEVGHIGSWEYDLQNDTFWGSEEAKKIYNLSQEKDDFTVQEVMQCVIEQDRYRVNQAMIDLVNKNKTYDITFTIVPKNTSKRLIIRSMAELQKDENGNPVKVTGVLHDITLQKTIEQELIEAKEQAEESDRLKTAFLANMSHEIRTPMNGILGFTDILRDSGLTSEEIDEYIEIIHKSGQRMMNTVNDIIEISKIEAGVVTTERHETNLNHSLEDVIKFFRPQANEKELELKLDQLLPESEAIIVTDKNKFEAILSNLVKNAIKYTDEGQINVGAAIKNTAIEFYVKDTGIGVPKHRREAIFNRFEQADISDTRAFQGSGLGLAISKSYVEMLGGEIWLESEENKGSVFYFSLPAKKIKEPNTPVLKNKETFSSPQPGISVFDRKLKVLVAEDDEDSFVFLTTIFRKYNWNIIHAETGRQAIEKFQEQPDIDLILMDIKLPDIDGYEATRQIKAINPKVPIIAQTAYALKSDRQKALEAGCDEYISKPIKKEALLKLVDQLLIE